MFTFVLWKKLLLRNCGESILSSRGVSWSNEFRGSDKGGSWQGVIKLPILGESNNANLWWFWGISLITTHCLGWCHIMTPWLKSASFPSPKNWGRQLSSPKNMGSYHDPTVLSIRNDQYHEGYVSKSWTQQSWVISTLRDIWMWFFGLVPSFWAILQCDTKIDHVTSFCGNGWLGFLNSTQ